MDQFLSYMNEEDIFNSFPIIGNVKASDVVHTVSYLHSNSHYKDYKHEELEMAFDKTYCL